MDTAIGATVEFQARQGRRQLTVVSPGAAAAHGLRPGDVIVVVDHALGSSSADLVKALQNRPEEGVLRLVVHRMSGRRALEIPLETPSRLTPAPEPGHQPGADPPSIAVLAALIPAIIGETTEGARLAARVEVLRRLGALEAAALGLSVETRRALVAEAAPRSPDLYLDHMVCVTARNIARSSGGPAPPWTEQPSLEYYVQGDPPYNPCTKCLGCGAALSANGKKLVRCPECRGTGLIVTATLHGVLDAAGILRRDNPFLWCRRDALSSVRVDEDMQVPADEAIRRNAPSFAQGQDPASQLDRWRAHRVEVVERTRAHDQELVVELANAERAFAGPDRERKAAYEHWVDPFAYTRGPANIPHEPGPPSTQWLTLSRRVNGARARLAQHRARMALVERRDRALESALSREARRR